MESKINDQYIKAIKKYYKETYDSDDSDIIPVGMEKYVIVYKKFFDRKLEEMLHSLSSHYTNSRKYFVPSRIPFMGGYIIIEGDPISCIDILDNGETRYRGLGIGVQRTVLVPPILNSCTRYTLTMISSKIPFPVGLTKVRLTPTQRMYGLRFSYDHHLYHHLFFTLGSPRRVICMDIHGEWQYFYETRSRNDFPKMSLKKFLRSLMEYNFLKFLDFTDLDKVKEKLIEEKK
jgi:hypothetical protein